MEWKKYYNGEMFLDEDYYDTYIFCGDKNNAQMVFMYDDFWWEKLSKKFCQKIVDRLNGKDVVFDKNEKHTYTLDTDKMVIFSDMSKDKPLLIIRGWGNLHGANNLSYEKSIEIQTQLGKYAIEQLNK